jgi:hypothetical protein
MRETPVCTVCGKPVDIKQDHYAVRNKLTKEMRYTHVECQNKRTTP